MSDFGAEVGWDVAEDFDVVPAGVAGGNGEDLASGPISSRIQFQVAATHCQGFEVVVGIRR